MQNLLLLNGLGSVDIGFFAGCAAVVVIIVAVYFLIPVFNKKQYKEQRDNLAMRENAFKSNKKTTVVLEETAQKTVTESTEPTVTEGNKGNE